MKTSKRKLGFLNIELLFCFAIMSILIPAIALFFFKSSKSLKTISDQLHQLNQAEQLMDYVSKKAQEAVQIHLSGPNELVFSLPQKTLTLKYAKNKIRLQYGQAIRYLSDEHFRCSQFKIQSLKPGYFWIDWYCNAFQFRQIIP